MKRLLTLAAMFLCCVATTFAQFSGSGSGTENDPYLILNPIHLNQLRNYLNQEGVYFKLMANIDLTEYLEDENPTQGWQPVGSSSSAAFKGILDGNGKTISGLWINRPNADYVGFFGYTVKATIKNVTIVANNIVGKDNVGALSGYGDNSTYTGVNFTTTKIQGASNVGGLAGNTGDNMTLSDNTVATVITATGDYVGGLIGINNAEHNLSVSNCQVNDSKITGNDNVGGAIGGNIGRHYTANALTSCYIHADITGNQRVGGICGLSKTRTINLTNCGYIGNINGTVYIGGLIGYINDCTTSGSQKGCFAVGSISGTSDYVGGLIGYDCGYYINNNNLVHNNVDNCYFSGSVSGRNYTAGLVGYKKFGTISNSYCSASVLGNQYVGGLVGYQEDNTTLKTSVAINTRVYATEGDVNRIVGYSIGTIAAVGSAEENKSYNRTIIVSQGVAKDIEDNLLNGTGVSLTTLKLKATFVAMGWDFTDTWAIQETECHPYMKTQTAPPVIQSAVISGATTISGKCVDGGTVTLEIDGEKQEKVSSGNNFSFTVSPLQAGHEVRISAKAEGKEPSYYTTEIVSFLGKGTEADPYQVYTAADLTCVYRRGYYKLMNDIDLSDYINQFSPTEGWESIGRDGSETIHFDGNGHKITGLWCNSTRDNTGLFSCFANGEIKNLTVETATGKQVKGGANTGILIGKMINGTIENCKVSGTVADGTPVGGMVGLFDGGSITSCQATVTIATTGETSYVGGLVGETTSGTVDQCVTTGTLSGSGTESYVGGLIGKNSATVTNCYSTATITSSYNAAGLIAYNYGLVEKCYALGNLASNNYAAGVIGYNDGENAVIRNCAAMNNIIDVTYESQQVQQGGGYGQRIIGGIKNNAPAPELNNYALKTMQVSVNDVPQTVYNDIMNGVAKTDEELKSAATYQTLGWDFDNVWNIDEGSSYPYQSLIVNGGTDPGDPNNPDPNDPNDPNNPNPQTTVEVTDISQLDNVIYIEPMEEMCGSQATISLKMKNSAAIRGFQFDLYLPTGVTVVKSSKGKIQGFLSAGRLPDEDEHTLTFSEQSDGAIRFLCSSQYEETFTGNDGEIATLKVNIADNMEDGEYPLQLKAMKLTENNISNYYETALVQSKLTISSYVLGDISGDGVVDVSDYTGVANHIHGNTPDGFNAKAADVDENNTIDVSDYTGIANIIHTGSIYGNSNSAHEMMLSPRRANTDLSTYDNVMYISPFTASTGTQTALSIKMKNTVAIRGFQFDLYLPEGMTVVKSNKGRIQGALSAGRLPDEDEHELTFSEQPDGAIRFLCSSQYDETFTGNDGEIATLQVNIAGTMANGDYPILMKAMKLTETDISKFYTADLIETTVTIGETDTRTVLDENDTTAPANATNVDVRVRRKIKANEWSTLVLPFDMTEAQVKTAFGDDVQLAEFGGWAVTEWNANDEATAIQVTFNNVSAITANTPYVIKVSQAMSEFTVDGVDIDVEDEPCVTVGKMGKGTFGSFTGSYVPVTIDDECLFLSDNKFWYSVGNTKMKGFRCYFYFQEVLASFSSGSGAKIGFTVDETNEIYNLTIDNLQFNADAWYTLEGVKLNKKPTKAGVYLHGGKKVVVK